MRRRAKPPRLSRQMVLRKVSQLEVGEELARHLQLWAIDWRNGGPTLKTIPDRMYSKQETKNNVVFSEFSIFDLSLSKWGGMNLCFKLAMKWWLSVQNTHQGCLRTAWKPTACIRMHIAIWPRRGVRTFLETKFAVGRLRESAGNGPVQPTIYTSASVPSKPFVTYWRLQLEGSELDQWKGTSGLLVGKRSWI